MVGGRVSLFRMSSNRRTAPLQTKGCGTHHLQPTPLQSLLDDLQEWYHAPVRGITGKKKKNQGLKVGHPPQHSAIKRQSTQTEVQLPSVSADVSSKEMDYGFLMDYFCRSRSWPKVAQPHQQCFENFHGGQHPQNTRMMLLPHPKRKRIAAYYSVFSWR